MGWKHGLETWAGNIPNCCYIELLHPLFPGVLVFVLETGMWKLQQVSSFMERWKQPTRGSKTGNFKSGKMSVYCREHRQVARRCFPNDKMGLRQPEQM